MVGCYWVLLASNGYRSRMLPNILQCTEHPSQQRMIWPQMSVVLRLRIPAMKDDIVAPILWKHNRRFRWLKQWLGRGRTRLLNQRAWLQSSHNPYAHRLCVRYRDAEIWMTILTASLGASKSFGLKNEKHLWRWVPGKMGSLLGPWFNQELEICCFLPLVIICHC